MPSAAYVDEFKAAAKRYYDAARAVRVAADTPDAAVPVTERDEAWDEFCKLTRRPDVMDAVLRSARATMPSSDAASRLRCRIFGHSWFEKNSETDCCRRCGKCRRGQ